MIKLTLPVSEDVVRKLKTGDEVYLDGDLVTGRDRVHERVVKDKTFPSVSLKACAWKNSRRILSALRASE